MHHRSGDDRGREGTFGGGREAEQPLLGPARRQVRHIVGLLRRLAPEAPEGRPRPGGRAADALGSAAAARGSDGAEAWAASAALPGNTSTRKVQGSGCSAAIMR